MSNVIAHNMSAMNAQRQMFKTSNSLSKSVEKLSSGYRINRAADDAAGLAISEKMRGQISGLQTASSNAQDGISLIQTAEGSLDETHSMLQRMRELANKTANGTYTSADRAQTQAEIEQLQSEITEITNKTEFNTMKLVNGSLSNGVTLTAEALGVDAANVDVKTQSAASAALAKIDAAIDQVSTQRAKLGAVQNRLEHTIANVDNSAENLQSAESRIRDTDMAKEMMNYTQKNVLAQATQTMLAQANQQPNQILSLLG